MDIIKNLIKKRYSDLVVGDKVMIKKKDSIYIPDGIYPVIRTRNCIEYYKEQGREVLCETCCHGFILIFIKVKGKRYSTCCMNLYDEHGIKLKEG